MQHAKLIKSMGISLCLLLSASCVASQPDAEAKSAKPAAAEASAEKCPAVGEVLKVLGQKQIYAQTPELFLPTLASHLKTGKDETKDLGPAEKMRSISLSADWLTSGEAVYRVIKAGAEFNSLTLDISKNCFNAPKDFIALGQNLIGKGGKKIKMPPPDTSEIIIWQWKDPDINMIRTLEITASQDSYLIAVKRDPDSEGAGG